MARTAEQYCDIYQTISTKQIDLVVADIMHPRFPITDIGTLSMLHGGEVIDAALESGRLVSPFAPKPVPVSDPAVADFDRLNRSCCQDEWNKLIDSAIAELEATKAEPVQVATPSDYLELEGLKLKNAARAHIDGYLLYVGEQNTVIDRCYELEEYGIRSYPKPNGSKYKLTIPLNQAGLVKDNRQSIVIAA